MKAYLQPPQPSRGLQRIADALVRYLPDGWKVVDHPIEADFRVLYAIGRRDRLRLQVDAMGKFGQRYAIIQVCLKSTLTPKASQWIDIWSGAEVVWSYYDLQAACDEDDQFQRYGAARDQFNFYHSPLGADAEVFYPRNMPKGYTIGTSGLSRLSESVRECALAAKQLDELVFHLGPTMPYDNVVSVTDIDDLQLATRWSMCHFVSGLRRKEGFELPAVEGLLCGARPICFKGADWEWNYGHHAIYIEETDRQGVIDQLVQLFRHGAPPVTPEERERAVERYDWKKIVGGFYERLR